MAELEEQVDTTVPEEEESVPEPIPGSIAEVPLEVAPAAHAVQPKAKARGQRGKDKKPRAKPKPKVKTQTVREAVIEYESDSEPSADEAMMEEIRALNMIRSIRSYHQTKEDSRRRLYASWFGR